ncbi:hypothetical protein TNCV_3557291 [Trichonephila clavipes]|uniref:Uncharacterized protein n=1 Tax=Trichonephila clavipes TaxID=2585209 RepID=A0A8X7BHS5_TRICX|nr:hypothetical protein TNCV_3557291 [Trichonephila clavipes]
MRSPSSGLAPPLNRLIFPQILTRCGRECVKRHRVLPIMVHQPSTHSRMDCKKPILQSSWRWCSTNMFLLSLHVLGFSEGGHPKISWWSTGRL